MISGVGFVVVSGASVCVTVTGEVVVTGFCVAGSVLAAEAGSVVVTAFFVVVAAFVVVSF